MVELLDTKQESTSGGGVSAVQGLIQVSVVNVLQVSDEISCYEFQAIDQQPLPAFAPGAHIDLHLNETYVRQYSLIESGSNCSRYRVAVKHDAGGRGGSIFMRDHLVVGSRLFISIPRNNFPLNAKAPKSIFIAGGIGITPFLSMCNYLEENGGAWELHYAVRSRNCLNILGDFKNDKRIKIYSQEEGERLSIFDLVKSSCQETNFYCCGPESLVRDFINLTENRNSETVHYEYFNVQSSVAEGEFEVVLERSRKSIFIKEGETILEALKRNGINTVSSCEQGICGACETKVLDGVPLHRDFILTDEEKALGQTMMICCSGSCNDKIVLDL